ncbi:nucleotide pyrophosphohydrolase [Desulfopila aestuarii]|uniref:NTP pyrophosphatase, house-cleaning of non-canonical NTPs n=1 Tax=Desulfopila aestuarii DSM 18488 TaxID=1121416 RepID=A0A1M7YAT2_9BACT|nr:nucleotide pyrophosphohydrolase [Desulfopila aestuarii]SHO49709.1 NTP pyrophosphatase, house-cleaning of non-canonical NTPs [Desulfopila aestuarii DSM 18488]
MKQLQTEIKEFIARRNWKQYHSPKNLVMALSVEAAELTEIFQWMTQEESRNVTKETRSHIEEEIGDIMIYLSTVAAAFDIDPISAARKKLVKNAIKYPAPKELSDDGNLT